MGRAVGAGALALGLVACGGGGSGKDAFKACMVADTGGLKDRSFNAEALAGMQQAAKAGSGIDVHSVTSDSPGQYAPKIAAYVRSGCDLIVTVGFSMGPATLASAKKNPDQHYTIVDYNSTPPQIKGLEFNTAQGAFLGGYFAAGMTKTGKVATYGGLDYPSVTIYMDGFWQGVQYYNSQHNDQVRVLGWSQDTQTGVFAKSFTNAAEGRKIAARFQDQGADIIFPVAGGTGLGSLQQAKASNGKLNVIWVDNDGFYSNPGYGSVIMTSVVKGIASAVSTVVTEAAEGNFDATPYIGTLANHGTDLAPFHDFSSTVPNSLASELDTVRQGIISDSIKVTSPHQPTGPAG